MTAARKKFKVTAAGIQVGATFRSESATYTWLRGYAEDHAGKVVVWIDDQHHDGWQRYEDVDLAVLAR